MLKRFTFLLITIALFVGFISFRSKYYSFQPPSNHSGTPNGGLCSDCHGNLNTGGGTVTVSGLPTNFQAGQTYPFSVTISHGAADRTRWGFEINAYNSGDAGIGTFGSTNPNAAINGGPYEISHYSAVTTAPSSSFTYTGLSWTAPSTITPGDNLVTFYIAGNAANNDGGPSGDFIYFRTMLAVLPITLKQFDYKIVDNYKVQLSWLTETESNSKEFIIEKSDDNSRFAEAGRMKAAGSSGEPKAYTFLDAKPSYFNQPVFYRLKLVDNDGKFKYSKVIQVTLKARETYITTLSPNPVKDAINLNIISAINDMADVTISTTQGSTISRHLIKISKGTGSYKMAIPSLSHGVYFLNFRSKEGTQTIRFVAL